MRAAGHDTDTVDATGIFSLCVSTREDVLGWLVCGAILDQGLLTKDPKDLSLFFLGAHDNRRYLKLSIWNVKKPLVRTLL